MVPVTTNQFFPVGQVAKMTGFHGFVMGFLIHPLVSSTFAGTSEGTKRFSFFFFMATFDFFRGFLPTAIF